MKTPRALRTFRFQLFVDRYINDPEYREKFDSDRVGALEGMGIEVTRKIKVALENLDIESLHRFGIAIDCC